MPDGIVPTLAELIALRSGARPAAPARRGRRGISGQAPSPQRGRGMEYAESRPYAHGDDARHIDWRLTARSGTPHTKVFQAERERLTLIVADTDPALYFGTRVRFKSVQAARIAAVAAWAAVRDGDRVAALRASRREAPVPPAGGPRGALRVIDALVRWYARQPPDDGGLPMALDHARRLLRPGSRVVVVGDALALAAIPPARWAAMALHNDVVALLVVDALEQAPPAAQLPFATDRTGAAARLQLDLGSAVQRGRWHAVFMAPAEATVERLRALGVVAAIVRADAAADAWLPRGRAGAAT
ncbi:MAG TPA: DUF58 domain-containing protein [Luteimonas sp.]|nr:DUF58 domain-containing protein [Luteimonas sp.]